MSEMPADIVQALIDNAKRLGLTWSLVPATVQETSVGTSKILVIVDGDDQPIYVDSLLGGLQVNTRVMLMTVPPSGNYIIGYVGGTLPRYALTFGETFICTQTLTPLTTANQVLVGCTTTFTLERAALLEATGVVDFFCSVTGASTCIGSVFVDGVSWFSALTTLRVQNDRDTVSSNSIMALAAGEHTVDLRARRDVVSGTHQAIFDNSRLTVKLYQ